MASSSSEIWQGAQKYPLRKVYEISLTVVSGFSLPRITTSHPGIHCTSDMPCLRLSKAIEILDIVRAGDFFEKWVLWVPEQYMEILQSDPYVRHFEITKSFNLSQINVMYYQKTNTAWLGSSLKPPSLNSPSPKQPKPWDPDRKLGAGELHDHVRRYFPLAINNSIHVDKSLTPYHRKEALGRYVVEEYWLPDSFIEDFERSIDRSGSVYRIIPASCQLQVRVKEAVALAPLMNIIAGFSNFSRIKITDKSLILQVNFPKQALPQLYFQLAFRPEIEEITCQDDASLDASLHEEVTFIKAILEKNEDFALQILKEGRVNPDACYYKHREYGFIPALILALEENMSTLAEKLVECLLSKPDLALCSILTPKGLFRSGIEGWSFKSDIFEKLEVFVQMQPRPAVHETCITMSHWQIACIVGHTKTMEFLLAKGLAPIQDSHAIEAMKHYLDHLSFSQEKTTESTLNFFPKPKGLEERPQLKLKISMGVFLLQCLGSLEGIQLPPVLQGEEFQQLLLSACTSPNSIVPQ